VPTFARLLLSVSSVLRRNDGNANLNNEFCSETHIDFMKVTKFRFGWLSL